MARNDNPPESSKPMDESRQGSLASIRSKPSPGLYLVSTPIGNLGDVTHRAISVLTHADAVACEDTRVTAKLLMLLGIPQKTLISYHDHNAAQAAPALLDRLGRGQCVALVSDAGAPLISDPGFPLVEQARALGIPVTALPGPSAVITALQLSGLPSDRFLFAGFLPPKSTQRRQVLREFAATPASLIFFESPNRLGASLADMAAILGNRAAAVTRELTKLYEESVRAPLDDLALRYRTQTTKGEIVVVVGPPIQAPPVSADALDDRIAALLAQGLGVKDAAQLIAAETGHPRRQVYARALSLAKP